MPKLAQKLGDRPYASYQYPDSSPISGSFGVEMDMSKPRIVSNQQLIQTKYN